MTPSIPPTVHSYTQTAYPSFSRVVPSLFPLVASFSLARLALSSVSFLPSRVQPTVKEKFSPGNSLPAGYRCIDESLRESRGNWMTATRREVSIRWFNQLARDASLSLSPILLPPFSFLLLNGSRCSVWPGQFGSWQVRWDPITRFSRLVNYRVVRLFRENPLEIIYFRNYGLFFESFSSENWNFLRVTSACYFLSSPFTFTFPFFPPISCNFSFLRSSSCFYSVSLSLSFYFLIYPHPPSPFFTT